MDDRDVDGDDPRGSMLWLYCVSAYPTQPEDCGMGHMDWREVWDGLSDHSGTPWAGLAAVARGASVVEVHFPTCGPDRKASLTHYELTTLCQGAKWIWRAMRSTEPKHDPEVVRLATANEAGVRGA